MRSHNNYDDDERITIILNTERWAGVMSDCVHEGFLKESGVDVPLC